MRPPHSVKMPSAQLAEGVGFEPTRLITWLFSRQLPSTARPPLLVVANGRRDRNRTCNLRFWRPLLCQLSYPPPVRCHHTIGSYALQLAYFLYLFTLGVPRTPGHERGAHSIGHARARCPRSQEKWEHVLFSTGQNMSNIWWRVHSINGREGWIVNDRLEGRRA